MRSAGKAFAPTTSLTSQIPVPGRVIYQHLVQSRSGALFQRPVSCKTGVILQIVGELSRSVPAAFVMRLLHTSKPYFEEFSTVGSRGMLSCRTAGKTLRYHFKILNEAKRKRALDIVRYSIVVLWQSTKATIGCGSTPVASTRRVVQNSLRRSIQCLDGIRMLESAMLTYRMCTTVTLAGVESLWALSKVNGSLGDGRCKSSWLQRT